jgi:hypothetical protein
MKTPSSIELKSSRRKEPIARQDCRGENGGSLVEDRDTAQLATVPFRLVLGELGIHRLEEGAHERDLVGRTNDVALEVVVLDCCRTKKRGRLLAIDPERVEISE